MALNGKVPVHYWIVAVLGTLWNAFGGYDYWMTRSRNVEYLSQMGDPKEMLAWIDSFPMWAQIGYGLGVWGSVLGSLLMLARSRFAPMAFLVSLAGAIISFTAQFTVSLPPASLDTTANKIIPFFILAVILFLWWYSKRAASQGLLR
jgi:hypothetical protein